MTQLYFVSAARIIDHLLGRLDVERAAFVGNSMGGYVVAELAALNPHRARRVALTGAGRGDDCRPAHREHLL